MATNVLDDNYPIHMPVNLYGLDVVAPTLMHAYWACSVQNHGDSVTFVLMAPSAEEARSRARSRLPNPGWASTKVLIRQSLQRSKFSPPAEREVLLAATPAEIADNGLSWLVLEIRGEEAVAEIVRPVVAPAEGRGQQVTYPGGHKVWLAPLVKVETVDTLLGVGGEQTVSQARAEMLSKFSLKKKVEQDCPCCGKRCVADARGITGTDGKCLITLCRAFVHRLPDRPSLAHFVANMERLWPEDGGPWLRTDRQGGLALESFGINVHDTSRTWTQLRYRGLLQERAKDPKDTMYQGSAYWRPTKLGMLFATGRAALPNKVTTFDNALALGPWMAGAAEDWNIVTIRGLRDFSFDAFMRGEL